MTPFASLPVAGAAEALPVPVPGDASAIGVGDVVEFLLKDPDTLDTLLRDETHQRALIPSLLGIALGGLAAYGVIATVMLNLARGAGFWLPFTPPAFWTEASALNLTLAYCLGMIAANGLCLPSFYFYTLLAGVRVSMVGVVAHALKGMAIGSIVLVAILPIYVAFALSAVIYATDAMVLAGFVLTALALPFLAGIAGAVSLHRGFMKLGDTLSPHHGAERRCLLRRLILAWSGCYTFVTPLVIYSLWHNLAKLTAALPGW